MSGPAASGDPLSPVAPDGAGRQGPLRQSLAIGFLCGVLAFALGASPARDQPIRWSATASAVVLPAPSTDEAADSGLYQTLGSGQLVRSLAAVGRLQRIESRALDRAGVAVDEEDLGVVVRVLPDTWVVEAEVTAADPALAERVVDAVIEQAASELGGRAEPFSFEVLDAAAGSAKRAGGGVTDLLATAALTALGVAVVAQQMMFHLLNRTPRQR